MDQFFETLYKIVDSSVVVIDRPKHSKHPRYPDYVYPLNYGYLDGTTSQDGGGIDVWCGSGNRRDVSGILVAVDPTKKDIEIKILLGCNEGEMRQAEECSNRGEMRTILIRKETKR